MRNKHRQSHNFWSLKSSIQILHKTQFYPVEAVITDPNAYPCSNTTCRATLKINFIYQNVQISPSEPAVRMTPIKFATADSSTTPEVR